MLQNLPATEILKKLLSKGGDFAEIYLERTHGTKIACEDKKIESAVMGVDSGAGLRLLANLKTAYGFTNEPDPPSLLNLASKTAGAMAGKNFTRAINLKTRKPKTVFPVQIDPAGVSTDDKVAMIRKAEGLAWSLDKRIVQVRLRYSDTIRHVEIANSEGDLVVSPRTLAVLSIFVTASDGKSYHTGYHSMGGHAGYEIFTEQDVDPFSKEAILLTEKLFGRYEPE